MDRQEYNRARIMELMNEIEVKRNRYTTPKANFEVIFPELTEEIWNAIDSKQPLSFLIEKLNKLSDSF